MAMMRGGDPQEPPDDVSSSALAELRRVCPVSSPSPGVHLAVRHDDVAALLADAEHFSAASLRSVQGHTPPQALTVQETEGKRHARLRRIWLDALRRDAIATAEPLVRQICGDLVASFATVGCADLVVALAKPAAKQGFAALIGVPDADRERVHRWTMDIRARESAVPAALKAQASTPGLSARPTVGVAFTSRQATSLAG
jgi:cytochrome P450